MSKEKNTLIKEWIYRNFRLQPDENYDVLSFGELEIGDKFISLPLPGDNNGHGGFKGEHYIFEKIKDEYRIDNLHLIDNAKKISRNILSHCPKGMPVIKIV